MGTVLLGSPDREQGEVQSAGNERSNLAAGHQVPMLGHSALLSRHHAQLGSSAGFQSGKLVTAKPREQNLAYLQKPRPQVVARPNRRSHHQPVQMRRDE